MDKPRSSILSTRLRKLRLSRKYPLTVNKIISYDQQNVSCFLLQDEQTVRSLAFYYIKLRELQRRKTIMEANIPTYSIGCIALFFLLSFKAGILHCSLKKVLKRVIHIFRRFLEGGSSPH
jgi:hypothetical protein